MERLLEYKYIHGMTLEQIAKKMHYSFSHIKRLHWLALNCVGCKDETQ
ncbi:sigma factor-like helix-turn-helix DNA-binding protein [Akkermansia muciniphila]